jgi:autotransporter adhesin
MAGGIGFTSPSGRIRGNVSAGGTTRGDFGGGAGLSITLN